jgi:hypothetical protein
MASLSVDALKQLIKYDSETGKLFWLPRDSSSFLLTTGRAGTPEAKITGFNTRFAGKEAFTTKLATGYMIATIGPEIYYAHRVAWAIHYGQWPVAEIDHINGDKASNAIVNLRDASREENSRNLKRSANNTSGVTGVVYDKSRGLWTAAIKRKGVHVNLGRFKDFDTAVVARKSAEKALGFHRNHGTDR